LALKNGFSDIEELVNITTYKYKFFQNIFDRNYKTFLTGQNIPVHKELQNTRPYQNRLKTNELPNVEELN